MTTTQPLPAELGTFPERVHGPHLAGVWRKVGIVAWAVLWCFCLLIFGSAIFVWFRWDSTPAALSALADPTMTPADVKSISDYQDVIRQAGLSLVVYGGLFAVLRLLSGLPYFVLSALIMRRRSDRLVAVLFAIVLAVIGAAGRWISANWVSLLNEYPWLRIPLMILDFLLDCSVIILIHFPRWAVCAALDTMAGRRGCAVRFFGQYPREYVVELHQFGGPVGIAAQPDSVCCRVVCPVRTAIFAGLTGCRSSRSSGSWLEWSHWVYSISRIT